MKFLCCDVPLGVPGRSRLEVGPVGNMVVLPIGAHAPRMCGCIVFHKKEAFAVHFGNEVDLQKILGLILKIFEVIRHLVEKAQVAGFILDHLPVLQLQ